MRSIFSVFPHAPFPDESFGPSNDTHYKVRQAARHGLLYASGHVCIFR